MQWNRIDNCYYILLYDIVGRKQIFSAKRAEINQRAFESFHDIAGMKNTEKELWVFVSYTPRCTDYANNNQ